VPEGIKSQYNRHETAQQQRRKIKRLRGKRGKGKRRFAIRPVKSGPPFQEHSGKGRLKRGPREIGTCSPRKRKREESLLTSRPTGRCSGHGENRNGKEAPRYRSEPRARKGTAVWAD